MHPDKDISGKYVIKAGRGGCFGKSAPILKTKYEIWKKSRHTLMCGWRAALHIRWLLNDCFRNWAVYEDIAFDLLTKGTQQ